MTELDVSALVFIDESGFDTKMTRLRGRSTRGQPCLGSGPHGHWRNNTFIAGLRADRVDAPMLLPGAMDGDAFAAWIGKALAPTLKAGDIVICDNLNVHKNAQARKEIETRGAELRFLPAYSPDLNPIEMLFAKIKAVVRAIAPRDFDALCKALKDALAALPPAECLNYIRHAGYDPT
jgi:transposase